MIIEAAIPEIPYNERNLLKERIDLFSLMEAIILAGGTGTRLKSMVSNVPKPMALINNKPFLEYIINFLLRNKIFRIILSVGYKSNQIKDYFGYNYKGCEIIYCVEDKPLGTGGAIKKALLLLKNNNAFILNGDTFFDINLATLWDSHYNHNAQLTLALKPMKNFDRYGSVGIDSKGVVQQFNEKKYQAEANINAGLYIVNRQLFEDITLNIKFSFEKFMEENIGNIKFNSVIYSDYFIDIGIPEDYLKAQRDFKEQYF